MPEPTHKPPGAPLEAVFLDAGGTLLREREPRARIYAEAARARGIAVADADMAVCMYRVHRELPRTLAGAFRYSERWFEAFIDRIFRVHLGLAAVSVPDVQQSLLARFADPATFAPVPGALELASGLAARGLCVGVVSNWSPALAGLLAGLGFGPELSFVLASAEVQAEKPEPEIFALALARAGVSRPEAALHLGDSYENDVAGARRAGLRALLFDPERRAAQPGGAIHSLAELEAWLEAHPE